MHHVSIRTADIHRAIAFYQGLGFEVTTRFTTGYTLACWMEGQAGQIDGRIELIQIPQPKPAPEAFGDEHYVGYYHVSFDLTEILTAQHPDSPPDLPQWLAALQQKFAADQLPPLRVLLAPGQQMIGDRVYEVMFLADSDGLPLEFIRQLGPQPSE